MATPQFYYLFFSGQLNIFGKERGRENFVFGVRLTEVQLPAKSFKNINVYFAFV